MFRPRAMPCLLLDGPRLVKTTRFAAPVYVGDPINAVKIFSDKEADELVLLDIGATRDGRGPSYELLARIAREAFMPMAYGGGVRTVEDVQRIIGLGFEKVVLNSVALDDPGFITRAAERCGSQSVIASVDVKTDFFGRKRVYSHARKAALGLDVREHVERCVASGAGEVLLGSVDRDGTMTGYDLDLVKEIAARVPVPVVAVGGAGSLDDLGRAVKAGASAAAAGSLFVFHGKRRAVLISYPERRALDALFGPGAATS